MTVMGVFFGSLFVLDRHAISDLSCNYDCSFFFSIKLYGTSILSKLWRERSASSTSPKFVGLCADFYGVHRGRQSLHAMANIPTCRRRTRRRTQEADIAANFVCLGTTTACLPHNPDSKFVVSCRVDGIPWLFESRNPSH